MTVYQVSYQPMDNVYLLGIFSSRKIANREIRKYHNETGASIHDFWIEAFKVDKVYNMGEVVL